MAQIHRPIPKPIKVEIRMPEEDGYYHPRIAVVDKGELEKDKVFWGRPGSVAPCCKGIQNFSWHVMHVGENARCWLDNMKRLLMLEYANVLQAIGFTVTVPLDYLVEATWEEQQMNKFTYSNLLVGLEELGDKHITEALVGGWQPPYIDVVMNRWAYNIRQLSKEQLVVLYEASCKQGVNTPRKEIEMLKTEYVQDARQYLQKSAIQQAEALCKDAVSAFQDAQKELEELGYEIYAVPDDDDNTTFNIRELNKEEEETEED